LYAPIRKIPAKMLPMKLDLSGERLSDLLHPIPIQIDRDNIIRDIRNSQPPNMPISTRAPDQNTNWRKPDYVLPGPLPVESPKHHWRTAAPPNVKGSARRARPAVSALKQNTLEHMFCPVLITVPLTPCLEFFPNISSPVRS